MKKLSFSFRSLRPWLVVLGLILLFLLALGTRRAILHANVQTYGADLPFTLEGALQFRNVERIYTEGGLDDWEPAIQYPEGIPVFETDTVLAEYVYAGLARVLPSSWSLPERVRWITVFWFCLSVPWLAIWITGWTRSVTGGALAGVLYAVGLASVIRSTGMEISRENFALPFLMAHLACDAWTVRCAGRRSSYRWAIGSAIALGFAMAAWDMIQFYVILFALVWWIRAVLGRISTRTDWLRVGVALGGLLVAGIASPYLRSHGFLLSPGMLLLYGVGVLLGVERYIGRRLTPGPRVAWALVPMIAYLIIPHAYGDSYGHFTELLWAKILFLNQKPLDPSLLTFNQRIMWVPALNSATLELTQMYFPVMLFLSLIAVGTSVVHGLGARRRSSDSNFTELPQYIFFFAVSLFAYVLFVRFHVYLALFVAAWIGWWAAWSLKRGGWRPYVIIPLIVFGIFLEAFHVLEKPARWGRVNVYYHEMLELTEWLREHVAPEPVLANFGVSASVLAYGQCPIILHPKFETRGIRERVQAYGESLFTGDEESFRDWADDHGATYYVYALGKFARQSPELQMRYMVDALEPPKHAAARLFEYAGEEEFTYFEHVWSNRKYRVLRIINREDEDQADRLTIMAERSLSEGNLDRAETEAWAALTLFPAQYRAREVIRHVSSLRDQGFGEHEPVEE